MALFGLPGPHAGAWNVGGFKLPDFGITERVSDAFGAPRNAQGGSQMQAVLGMQAPTFPTQTYTPVNPAVKGVGASIVSRQSSGGGSNSGGQPSGGQPSGGGGGGSSVATPNFDALISQINSLSDQAMSALDPQKASQEQVVSNNFTQGVSDLQYGQNQGNALLDTSYRKAGENQVKTLADLTDNLKNMFTSGQNYLGARGAGDSSAASQYSYALTQLANKNRGQVLDQTNSIYADIQDRRSQLLSQFNQGQQQLQTQKSNQLLAISQWYADAQNSIRQAKGQNIMALGQQALSYAMNAVSQVNANYQARQNSLLTWAENNSKNIIELQKNMQATGQTNYNMPVAANIPGLTTGAVGSNGQYYPGSNSNQKTDMYGNPITG